MLPYPCEMLSESLWVDLLGLGLPSGFLLGEGKALSLRVATSGLEALA